MNELEKQEQLVKDLKSRMKNILTQFLTLARTYDILEGELKLQEMKLLKIKGIERLLPKRLDEE